MSKFAGTGATVNKPDALTHGKPCVVERWDRKAKKYEVSFDGAWVGWYKLKELTMDTE